MYRTAAFRVTAAAAAAVGVLLAAGLSASAPAAAAPPAPPGPPGSVVDLPAGMLEALEADLGIGADRAEQVLADQAAAAQTGKTLQGALGDAYAGAVYDLASGDLTVSVTDPAAAETVSAAGALPEVVTHSGADLDAVSTQMQELSSGADLSGVYGWRVDPASNSVVVTVDPSTLTTAAVGFIAQATALSPAVVTEYETEQPRLYADVVGGDAFHINGTTRCSIGFAVEGGFVTAGHCGAPGDTTSAPDGAAQGAFQGSSFPTNDYAWVGTNPEWTPRPWVNTGTGTVAVAGSEEALAGSAVCRSGSTTGWHCGEILALAQTVVYPEGAVDGLTRTDVCAEPGDSGGPYVSGNQAQGVTSGGSGDCTNGGVTYFQPVNEILDTYGLALTVSDA